MKNYNGVSFPPIGEWDRRLVEPACPELQPVRTVHRNPWFLVNDRAGYFTVEYHLRQVAVLPVIEDAAIVMVRVKRPVIGDVTLELPAGGIEETEEPAGAAARELGEEAGIVLDPARFVPMPPLSISSTRMPRLSYVYRVTLTEEEFAARAPHDHEVTGVERIGLAELPRLMATGKLYVSLSLAVVGMFLCMRDSARP